MKQTKSYCFQDHRNQAQLKGSKKSTELFMTRENDPLLFMINLRKDFLHVPIEF